jgi:HK97 family phage portal protein
MGLLDLKFKKDVKALNTNAKWTIVNGQWLTPEDQADTYINLGYKNLPNVYGIISLITQKSSIVPFEVMRVTNKTAAAKYKAALKSAKKPKDFSRALKYKAQAFEQVENSELERLLLKPNELQSIEELFEAYDGYLLLTGSGYMLGDTPGLGKNASKIKELHVLPSPTVDIIANKDFTIDAFKVSYFPNKVPAEFIGYSKYFNPIASGDTPQNMLKGMSPLAACRNLLKKYESADIAQGAMFKNMGPAGVLSGESNSDLREEQALSIKDKFKQFHQGAVKAGDIIVTPAKLSWTQIGLSPVDLNVIEGKKEILGELCNVYHVPIGLFSDENSTDNNLENSRKMLITDAVIPVVEKRKQMLNSWLAPKFGDDLYIEFDYSVFPEMQEDIKEQAETANLMWWLTANEKRELTGYDVDTDPLMNKKYIPANLMPLEESDIIPIDEDLIKE